MKNKIIDQIKKAMRLEKSNRLFGNKNEAVNCLNLIKLLRKKHNITEEISLDETPDYDTELVFPATSEMFRRRRIVWQEIMFEAVARFFDCQPLVRAGTNLKIVAGSPAARRKVVDSYLFFHTGGSEAAQAYLLGQLIDAPEEAAPDRRKLMKSSFLHGFSLGLMSRLGQVKASEDNLSRGERHYADLAEGSGQQSQSLVPSSAASSSAKQAELVRKLRRAPKVSTAFVEKLDEEAFIAGSNAGWTGALPPEIADYIDAHASRVRDFSANVAEADRRRNQANRNESVDFEATATALSTVDSCSARNRRFSNFPARRSSSSPASSQPAVQMNLNFVE